MGNGTGEIRREEIREGDGMDSKPWEKGNRREIKVDRWKNGKGRRENGDKRTRR